MTRLKSKFLIIATLITSLGGLVLSGQESEETIRAVVQLRPGGPMIESEVKIEEVPVNPPTISAEQSELPDDDLVLGVVAGGRAMAWPIRYLAQFEVVNDTVGGTPLTPTW